MLWAIILEPLAEIFMPILQKLKTHHKHLALSILFAIALVLYYFGQNTELLDFLQNHNTPSTNPANWQFAKSLI